MVFVFLFKRIYFFDFFVFKTITTQHTYFMFFKVKITFNRKLSAKLKKLKKGQKGPKKIRKRIIFQNSNLSKSDL